MASNNFTILLAHGSRDPRWAEPFEELISRVGAQHAQVGLAYMELATPSLDEAVAGAIDGGATVVTVLPLFFAAGKHLREDVPKMLQSLEQQYDIEIKLLPPIGSLQPFQDMVADLVGELASD